MILLSLTSLYFALSLVVRPGFPLTVDPTEPGGIAACALLSVGPHLTDSALPGSFTSLLFRTFEWLASRPSPHSGICDIMVDPLTRKKCHQIPRAFLLLSLHNISFSSPGHFVIQADCSN